MAIARQFWFLNRGVGSRPKILFPVMGVCLMLVSSFSPWLVDPLFGSSSAWRLAVDIGWQVRTPFISYGVLCLLCALYTSCVVCAHEKTFRGSTLFVNKYIVAALLCLLPVLIFFVQYLFTDVVGAHVLSQHKIQMLLMQRHFGYSSQADRITIDPFLFTDFTVLGRLQLLIDQVSIGLLLPLIASWLLFECRRTMTLPLYTPSASVASKYGWVLGLGLLLILLGRGPVATICDFEGSQSLSSGNYTKALNWLDWAQTLNPSLLQVASFHIERGQALYFLHPKEVSDESQVYLASVYRSQKDFIDSYQELLSVWQAHPTTPWVVSEMSITIEKLAEFTRPLNKAPVTLRPDNDDSALIWIKLLTKVDSTNLYGQYVDGLIMYDLHNYSACTAQMAIILNTKPDADIHSSAITYIALSDIRVGKILEGRNLLFEALKFDPSYRNNTAREALSGLY